MERQQVLGLRSMQPDGGAALDWSVGDESDPRMLIARVARGGAQACMGSCIVELAGDDGALAELVTAHVDAGAAQELAVAARAARLAWSLDAQPEAHVLVARVGSGDLERVARDAAQLGMLRAMRPSSVVIARHVAPEGWSASVTLGAFRTAGAAACAFGGAELEAARALARHVAAAARAARERWPTEHRRLVRAIASHLRAVPGAIDALRRCGELVIDWVTDVWAARVEGSEAALQVFARARGEDALTRLGKRLGCEPREALGRAMSGAVRSIDLSGSLDGEPPVRRALLRALAEVGFKWIGEAKVEGWGERPFGGLVVASVERVATPCEVEVLREIGRLIGAALERTPAAPVVGIGDGSSRLVVPLTARDDLLACISRELRDALAGIVASAALLKKAQVAAGRRDAQADAILRAAKRVGTLVEDLLDLERLESGTAPLGLREVDLPSIARDACALSRPIATERRVVVDCAVQGGPQTCMADGDRVQRVLSSLVDDAVKLSPPGGRVSVVVREADGSVDVSVSDEGPGIAVADLPRVVGGAELGLAIAKAIVEGYGGRIWAESAPGKGNTFTLTTPVRATATRAPPTS